MNLDDYRLLVALGAADGTEEPYATALKVCDAPDRDAALAKLHPEMREVVEMLLNAETAPEPAPEPEPEARRLIEELNNANSVLLDCMKAAATAEAENFRTTNVVLTLRLRGTEPDAEQLRRFYAAGAQHVSAQAMLDGAKEEHGKVHYRVMRHLGGERARRRAPTYDFTLNVKAMATLAAELEKHKTAIESVDESGEKP